MGEKLVDKMRFLVGIEKEEAQPEVEEKLEKGKSHEDDYFKKINLDIDKYSSKHSLDNYKGMEIETVELVVVEPSDFDECSKIVDHLKNRKPIILNLEKTDSEIGRKIFDFVSGGAYAIDGTIKRISDNIFVVAPRNVDISNSSEGSNEEEVNPWKNSGGNICGC